MRIVVVLGQKGGVGKSTIVMNLAAVSAEHSRVLAADTDHKQQTLTSWAAAADESGKPLAFDFDAIDEPGVLAQLREFSEYDLIYVDTPGSLADSELPRLEAILDIADFVVMPIEPKFASIQPLVTTIDTLVRPRGLPYRVLLSRVRRDGPGEKRRDDTAATLDEMGLPRFRTTVREYTVHEDAPIDGSVVTTYAPSRGATNALDDFKSLALELNSIWANGGSK